MAEEAAQEVSRQIYEEMIGYYEGAATGQMPDKLHYTRTIAFDLASGAIDESEAAMTLAMRYRLGGFMTTKETKDSEHFDFYLIGLNGQPIVDDRELASRGVKVPLAVHELRIDRSRSEYFLPGVPSHLPDGRENPAAINRTVRDARGNWISGFDPNYTGTPYDKYGRPIRCKRTLPTELEAHFIESNPPHESFHHQLTYRDFNDVKCSIGWFYVKGQCYATPYGFNRNPPTQDYVRALAGSISAHSLGTWGGNTSDAKLAQDHPLLWKVAWGRKFLRWLAYGRGNDGVWGHTSWREKVLSVMGKGGMRLLSPTAHRVIQRLHDNTFLLPNLADYDPSTGKFTAQLDPKADPNLNPARKPTRWTREVPGAKGIYMVQTLDGEKHLEVVANREHPILYGLSLHLIDLDKIGANIRTRFWTRVDSLAYLRETFAPQKVEYIKAWIQTGGGKKKSKGNSDRPSSGGGGPGLYETLSGGKKSGWSLDSLKQRRK